MVWLPLDACLHPQSVTLLRVQGALLQAAWCLELGPTNCNGV
jgi:hypothetical protein